jgi:HNH endonuclease
MFLAFLAVGLFSVATTSPTRRHRRLIAGSHIGTPPYWKAIPQRAAACSESDGYPTVMFSDGEKRHKVFAHRIVWMVRNQADIPPGMEVNHENGKRGDTTPSNLTLMTPSQNAIHGIQVLGRKQRDQSGEKNHAAQLTAGQVSDIRKLSGKMAQSQLAAMFGVTQGTISDAVTGKTWKHLP